MEFASALTYARNTCGSPRDEKKGNSLVSMQSAKTNKAMKNSHVFRSYCPLFR